MSVKASNPPELGSAQIPNGRFISAVSASPSISPRRPVPITVGVICT